MHPSPDTLRAAVAALLALLLAPASPPAAAGEPALRVASLNAWHGLRTEGVWRFPGESRERSERRFALQVEELRRLDPDVVFLQEVNPSPRRSRRYARLLGMTEIHVVTSCGVHLGPIKIPANMNEGLTILARPELGLRRVGLEVLSGRRRCWGDHLGFQTKEARYALVGEISWLGRRVLLVDTHLHGAPWVAPDFEERLAELVARGVLTPDQRREILEELEGHRRRTLDEMERLLAVIERRAGAAAGSPAVVLAGDLNSTPDSEVVRAAEGAGLRAAAASTAERPLVTWDPVRNADNYRIGAKLEPPLPTFGRVEVEELLKEREVTPRQIDWVFVSAAWGATACEVVFDQPRDGLFASDHFGLACELIGS